ncbi:hypothetical protein V1264_006302 [Littorina saxatilis]|uniref:Reverse transcriptase n=1 Tax=Littorina saxatilis TaxID=31220 RepID=A0AAN9G4C3_9CAEN
MAEFWAKGVELGLKGKQLTEFVESQTRLQAQREERQAQREERQAQREREERQAQREREEKERQAQREREERQAQREEREAQREERQMELKRVELQIEMETKRLELQTEMVRVQNEQAAPRQRDNQQQMLHRAPKLPAFADGKDQIDCYLARFERFAESARWQRDDWAIQLSAHLTGAALEVYTRLSNDDARDYDVLKEALLRCYNFTERGYRQRFRECQPLSGETPSQFVERLSSYLQKWVELSGEEQSYESLRDLIVKEQFLNACPKDLATRLEEQKLRGLKDITDAAERYLIAHGRTLGTSKSSKPFQKSGNQGNQPAKGQTESAPSSNEGQNITCFHCNAKGHRVANCPQKKNNGHVNDKAQEHRRRYYDNKRQTSGSNQQVCASSVILPRAAEQVDTPLDVEECLSDGQLLLANGKSISVVASAAVSVSNMPVSKGFVEKQEVTVLRDSGCNGVIVKEDLVPTEKFTGDFKWTLMADSKCVRAPVAKIQIDTPYFTGEVEAVCLKKPLYDLLIGNIGGARRPDDPDVEWRMGAAQPAVEEDDPLPFANEDISELLRDDRATVHRRDQPQVVSAVTTRAQAKKDKTTTPLRVTNSSATAVVDRDRLIQLQEADSTLTKYRSRPVKEMTKGEGTVQFEVKAKILYRVFQHARVNGGKPLRQVLVPQPLRRQVMEVAHDSIMGGHLGVKKTSDRIQAAFYWPGLHADVTRFCRSCDICQKTIPRGRVPKVPLQKMPLIDRPFKRVAIDLIGEIKPPSEEGHRWVLTLVDYATRYPEAVPLKKIDTETVAEALVDIFSRIGVPEEILTDLGTQFVSECMEEVNRLLSIRHLTTTPYHPMCNGLVEKFNATLKSTLKKLCSEQPRQWHRYINALLFAYREVPQESTGFSPFELMYGRTVRGPMQILKELWTKDVDTPEVKNSYQYVFELREKLEETLEIVRENLKKSQDSGKHYYDRKAVNRKFTPGNKVLILLPTDHNKLLMQWEGPYEVEAVVGINDFEVNVGKKSKIYHANLLKLYVERPPEAVQVAASVEEPAELDEFDGEELLELGDLHKKEGVDDVKLGPDLTKDQQKELHDFMGDFTHRFSDVPGSTSLVEHEVHLTSDVPVRSKPYPIPFQARESLKKDIDSMLKMGVIRESSSPYSSPVVVVKKKDGTNRVCIDFRKVNKITVFDPEPMPTAADLFRRLTGSKIFSKIDLSKGYWQIPVREEDIPKTAFATPDGTYECLRMPFGMVNSGATLKRRMRKMLKGMKNVVYYWDDLLVHTETFEEHLETLRELFSRLTKANLTVRPSKCILGTDNVDFIGHSLKEGQKGLLLENVTKILNAPRPETKKQVRSFLGLAGYYREFIPNFAAITAPLSDMTRKGCPNRILWGSAQEKAYQTVRDLMSRDPVLRLPDTAKEFILRTDASDEGIGAMLMQEHGGKPFPVSYASKKLSGAEKNYSTMEKECLAIVWGIKKFELYLQGVKFVLQTDHKPLTYLNSAKCVNNRIMRWVMYLQNFDMRVESIKGSDNVGADFLSRVCE